MSTERITRSRRRPGWSVLAQALAVLGVVLVFATDATAAGRKFPVPTCNWVSSAVIGKILGVPVKAVKPVWSTQIAPVLTCGFDERLANLQSSGAEVAAVQFRELQRFKPGKGWTFVPGLGSCVEKSSCPEPHRAAWERVVYTQALTTLPGSEQSGTSSTASSTSPSSTSTTPSSTTPSTVVPAPAYVSAVGLRVEDGLNSITILVDNPNGPLPAASETLAVQQLAKKLLPEFLWN